MVPTQGLKSFHSTLRELLAQRDGMGREVRGVFRMGNTLSDPMDCDLPGSSVHGIFQARVLEWDAIAFSDSVKAVLRGRFEES